MDRPNRGPSCDVEPFSLPPARSRSRPRCEGQRRRAAESRLHRLSEGGRGTGRQGARAVGEALGSRRRRDQTGGIPIRPPMLEALSAGGIDYAYCGARRRSSRKRVTRTCSRQRRFPRAVLGRRSSCRKVRRSGLPPISKARRLGSPKAPARVICSSRCESAPSVKPAGFKSFKELPRRSAAGPPPRRFTDLLRKPRQGDPTRSASVACRARSLSQRDQGAPARFARERWVRPRVSRHEGRPCATDWS